MKHGTYAEAIEAGFTPEQAGFFARFGVDTKDEVEERVLRVLEKRKEAQSKSLWLANLLRKLADKID